MHKIVLFLAVLAMLSGCVHMGQYDPSTQRDCYSVSRMLEER